MQKDLLPSLLDVDDRGSSERGLFGERFLGERTRASLGDSAAYCRVKLPIFFKAGASHSQIGQVLESGNSCRISWNRCQMPMTVIGNDIFKRLIILDACEEILLVSARELESEG